MIIGNGLIGTAMRSIDKDDLLIFASGVSNSMETDPKAYQREYNLLKESIVKYPNKKLIYFSTCSVYDVSRRKDTYIEFKLKIEKFITNTLSSYVIFRVGNVVARGGNPNTLINYLTTSIINKKQFTMFSDAKRYLIGIDDVVRFIKNYQDRLHNKIIDLYFPYQYSILELTKRLEDILDKTAIYESKEIGYKYLSTQTPLLNEFFGKYDAQTYLNKILRNYNINAANNHTPS